MMVKKYGCGKLLQVVKKVVKFQKVESLTHQHYNDSHTFVLLVITRLQFILSIVTCGTVVLTTTLRLLVNLVNCGHFEK